MTDGELSDALNLLSSEMARRERESARFHKAALAKQGKRDPRCPACHVRLAKDGRRSDGVGRYECPKCHRHYSDTSNTSLSSSKLPPKKIRETLTLITLDCPDWVVAEIAGNGFCKLHSEKLGMPTREMVLGALGGRIEEGSLLTHDGAPSHNLLVKRLKLVDDWCKFVPGEREYEAKMKLMSNCCSYLRHAFESHPGIKFAKLEAYANFFMYRWTRVRKHGLKATIEYLFRRVCGAEKSKLSEPLF